jgi:hypothetical protein
MEMLTGCSRTLTIPLGSSSAPSSCSDHFQPEHRDDGETMSKFNETQVENLRACRASSGYARFTHHPGVRFATAHTLAFAVLLAWGCGSNGGAPCVSETDAAFCTRVGKDCGAVSGTDNCSVARSVTNCGTCASPQVCAGRGTANVCETPAATPTLVQHLSHGSTPISITANTGNNFSFWLPNNVGAGNAIIVAINYEWSATRTVSITDNNGNAWPSTPTVGPTDAGANSSAAIYVLLNAHAGATKITVTCDAVLRNFQFTASEWMNIATASAVAGSSASTSTTSPNVSSGSFTPTNNDGTGGNLIWTYICNVGAADSDKVTNFAAGGSATLLDADIAWGANGLFHASEYVVQTAATAINPGMTVTSTPGNSTYHALSVALKAASAGTAKPTGIHVLRVSHMTNDVPPLSWPIQFPSSGNLIVITFAAQTGTINISGVTDTKSNTYAKIQPATDEPQFWYASNATTDPTLKFTITSSAASNSSLTVYDIEGADPNPVDGSIGVGSTNDPLGVNMSDQPVFTPASVNGLVIVVLQCGIGPTSAFNTGTPSGAFFNSVSYPGEVDGDTIDNADGYAHYYNPDLTTEHWNWVIANGGVTHSVSSVAVHFKSR